MVRRLPTATLSAERVNALLPLARAGDRDAADELIKGLMGFCIRQSEKYADRTPAADPDELLQAGLLAVWRAILGNYDPSRGATWRTYAMRAVVYAVIREAKRAVARRDLEPTLDHCDPVGGDDSPPDSHPLAPPDRPDDQLSDVAAVRDALDGLDPAERALVESVWGLTADAVTIGRKAAALGLSPRRARGEMSRALDLIRDHARRVRGAA